VSPYIYLPLVLNQSISYPNANDIHGILVFPSFPSWLPCVCLSKKEKKDSLLCLCRRTINMSLLVDTPHPHHIIKLLIMKLAITNKIVHTKQARMRWFRVRVEKLGIAFNIRHFCFRTPKACSMTLWRDECKKLNIS